MSLALIATNGLPQLTIAAMTARGERNVGRIYKHVAGPQTGAWFWAMNAFGPGIIRRDWNLTETEDTKDAAAAKVERACVNASAGLSKSVYHKCG